MAKVLSPVGRIVQGNPLQAWPVTDDNGKAKLKDDGVTPRQNWWITVAIPKVDETTRQPIQANHDFIAGIYQEAARAFPQLFPQGYVPGHQNQGCVRQDFAFKVIDGDGIDNNGKPHANKEGWRDHWILRISTEAGVMRCYDGLANNAIIDNQEAIHTGKYVRVSLDIKSNGWTGQVTSKPGLFLNPDGVQLVGHGAKIQSGPDANTMFAAPVSGGYVPAAMSTTPVASVAMPGQPVMPQMQAPAPQAQPVYTMTAAAQGYTREQWHQAGQSDEQLIAAGYMTVSTPAPQQPVMPQMQAPAPQPQMAAPQPVMPQMQAPVPMGNAPQMQAPQMAPQAQAPVMPQMQVANPQPFTQPAAQQRTYTMTPSAQGYTREQWHAAGQTDDTLVAAGMMVIS